MAQPAPQAFPPHPLTPYLGVLVIAGFLAAITLPAFRMAAGPAPMGGENRPLAPAPSLATARNPGLFLYELKKYIQDNFGFRSGLVRLHAILARRVLRSSPSAGVILGSGGWLYQANERVIEDYRRTAPFTPAQLDAWAVALEARRAWLAARGIAYVFVVAPNPHTIYPEHLPGWCTPLARPSRLDDLVARLTSSTQVRCIDVRPALHAAKSNSRLYHRTDTHWNDHGAFVAYREIARHVADLIPGFTALEQDGLTSIVEDAPGGDLAGFIGLADVNREEWLRLYPASPHARITPPWDEQARQVRAIDLEKRIADGGNPAGPRALILHDSFGVNLIPFLAEGFSHARFQWTDQFDTALIESEHPDIIIHEVTERYLMGPPPAAPPD